MQYLYFAKIPVKFRFRPNLFNYGSGSGQISIPVDLWYGMLIMYRIRFLFFNDDNAYQQWINNIYLLEYLLNILITGIVLPAQVGAGAA